MELTAPRRPGLLRRFARDQHGVSAVEFALIAPLMITFYFGIVEICQAYMAQKRVGHVASMVGDLTAQADTLNAGEVDDIFAIGDLILRPFPAEGLSVRVSSIVRGSDNVARVEWSRGDGMAALEKDATVAVPEGLIDVAGETVILSESVYEYRSLISDLLPRVSEFSQTYYLRPRSVDKVVYTP